MMTAHDFPAGAAQAPASNKTIVIKYGGAAMAATGPDGGFVHDLLALRASGARVVLVHGGGSEVTALAARLEVEAEFVNGQRRTDSRMMQAVTMALAGTVNTELVRLINASGGAAVGLSGVDGDLLRARRLTEPDLGLVGMVEGVNVPLLELLLNAGYIPVIATIGAGERGGVYNINADIAAGAVAGALRADLLVYMSDIEGVRHGEELLEEITPQEARELILLGVIHGGMVPKVESALEALAGGVGGVHIIDGRNAGAFKSLLGGGRTGTVITGSGSRGAAEVSAAAVEIDEEIIRNRGGIA